MYNRNVSIASLLFAVLVLSVSILFAKKLLVLADGAILGGVLTLVYSIIRGFQAGDPKFRFVVVSAGLVIAVILGYLKFIRDHIEVARVKKK